MSSMSAVGAGVLQNSILGATLFLLYINDLPSITSNLTVMFAEYVSILKVVTSNNERPLVHRSLQDDINSINATAEIDQVSFVPHKTQALLISRK